MITIVKEPEIKYEVNRWLPNKPLFSVDENIDSIEKNIIWFYNYSGKTTQLFFEKPKMKLSSLRGQMTKQNEMEIDNQISSLRKEWDRNI